jgi:hypothetical protein
VLGLCVGALLSLTIPICPDDFCVLVHPPPAVWKRRALVASLTLIGLVVGLIVAAALHARSRRPSA